MPLAPEFAVAQSCLSPNGLWFLVLVVKVLGICCEEKSCETNAALARQRSILGDGVHDTANFVTLNTLYVSIEKLCSKALSCNGHLSFASYNLPCSLCHYAASKALTGAGCLYAME